MFVVIPKAARFQLNPSKHTVSVAERFKAPRISLLGSVKAAIAQTSEEALEIVKRDVKSHLDRIESPTVTADDFKLIYSTEEIVDGRFWAGTEVVSECTL